MVIIVYGLKQRRLYLLKAYFFKGFSKLQECEMETNNKEMDEVDAKTCAHIMTQHSITHRMALCLF